MEIIGLMFNRFCKCNCIQSEKQKNQSEIEKIDQLRKKKQFMQKSIDQIKEKIANVRLERTQNLHSIKLLQENMRVEVENLQQQSESFVDLLTLVKIKNPDRNLNQDQNQSVQNQTEEQIKHVIEIETMLHRLKKYCTQHNVCSKINQIVTAQINKITEMKRDFRERILSIL